MNYQQFKALKAGDVIENAMTGGRGTVTAATDVRGQRVVSLRWSAGLEFKFTEHSTAWMHWTLDPGEPPHPVFDANEGA